MSLMDRLADGGGMLGRDAQFGAGRAFAPRSAAWRLFWIGVAFTAGVMTASHNEWRDPVRQLLLATGAAHLTRLEAVQPIGFRSSEYLLVLNRDADLPTARRFFDTHPEIDYQGESVFPRTHRVSLNVPVTDARRDLEAQPFTQLLVRNHLLVFCQ